MAGGDDSHGCRLIVRTIPGQSTGRDDDRYVCSDGSVWKRCYGSFFMDGTASGPTAWLHGNYVCHHK
jgi:hypothetical protein